VVEAEEKRRRGEDRVLYSGWGQDARGLCPKVKVNVLSVLRAHPPLTLTSSLSLHGACDSSSCSDI
jgi:hypothetical protein